MGCCGSGEAANLKHGGRDVEKKQVHSRPPSAQKNPIAAAAASGANATKKKNEDDATTTLDPLAETKKGLAMSPIEASHTDFIPLNAVDINNNNNSGGSHLTAAFQFSTRCARIELAVGIASLQALGHKSDLAADVLLNAQELQQKFDDHIAAKVAELQQKDNASARRKRRRRRRRDRKKREETAHTPIGTGGAVADAGFLADGTTSTTTTTTASGHSSKYAMALGATSASDDDKTPSDQIGDDDTSDDDAAEKKDFDDPFSPIILRVGEVLKEICDKFLTEDDRQRKMTNAAEMVSAALACFEDDKNFDASKDLFKRRGSLVATAAAALQSSAAADDQPTNNDKSTDEEKNAGGTNDSNTVSPLCAAAGGDNNSKPGDNNNGDNNDINGSNKSDASPSIASSAGQQLFKEELAKQQQKQKQHQTLGGTGGRDTMMMAGSKGGGGGGGEGGAGAGGSATGGNGSEDAAPGTVDRRQGAEYAVLSCLNAPSFLDLAADQPRFAAFRADEALLKALQQQQQLEQQQLEQKKKKKEKGGAGTGSAVAFSPPPADVAAAAAAQKSAAALNPVLQFIAKEVEKQKWRLYDGKVQRDGGEDDDDDDNNNNSNRNAGEDREEEGMKLPSSPTTLAALGSTMMSKAPMQRASSPNSPNPALQSNSFPVATGINNNNNNKAKQQQQHKLSSRSTGVPECFSQLKQFFKEMNSQTFAYLPPDEKERHLKAAEAALLTSRAHVRGLQPSSSEKVLLEPVLGHYEQLLKAFGHKCREEDATYGLLMMAQQQQQQSNPSAPSLNGNKNSAAGNDSKSSNAAAEAAAAAVSKDVLDDLRDTMEQLCAPLPAAATSGPVNSKNNSNKAALQQQDTQLKALKMFTREAIEQVEESAAATATEKAVLISALTAMCDVVEGSVGWFRNPSNTAPRSAVQLLGGSMSHIALKQTLQQQQQQQQTNSTTHGRNLSSSQQTSSAAVGGAPPSSSSSSTLRTSDGKQGTISHSIGSHNNNGSTKNVQPLDDGSLVSSAGAPSLSTAKTVAQRSQEQKQRLVEQQEKNKRLLQEQQQVRAHGGGGAARSNSNNNSSPNAINNLAAAAAAAASRLNASPPGRQRGVNSGSSGSNNDIDGNTAAPDSPPGHRGTDTRGRLPPVVNRRRPRSATNSIVGVIAGHIAGGSNSNNRSSVECVSASYRNPVLQSEQALVEAARFRIAATPSQKQHTTAALEKSAQIMALLKMQLLNLAVTAEEGSELQPGTVVGDSPRRGAGSKQPIAALSNVRAALASLTTDSFNNDFTAEQQQQKLAEAEELLRNVSQALQGNPGIDRNLVDPLLQHYGDALHLLQETNSGWDAEHRTGGGIHSNSNNNNKNNSAFTSNGQKNLNAPAPGSAAAAAIGGVSDMLDQLNSIAHKIAAPGFQSLSVNERTRLVANAKGLLAQAQKKMMPLSAEEQRAMNPVFDSMGNLFKSVNLAATAVVLKQASMPRSGAAAVSSSSSFSPTLSTNARFPNSNNNNNNNNSPFKTPAFVAHPDDNTAGGGAMGTGGGGGGGVCADDNSIVGVSINNNNKNDSSFVDDLIRNFDPRTPEAAAQISAIKTLAFQDRMTQKQLAQFQKMQEQMQQHLIGKSGGGGGGRGGPSSAANNKSNSPPNGKKKSGSDLRDENHDDDRADRNTIPGFVPDEGDDHDGDAQRNSSNSNRRQIEDGNDALHSNGSVNDDGGGGGNSSANKRNTRFGHTDKHSTFDAILHPNAVADGPLNEHDVGKLAQDAGVKLNDEAAIAALAPGSNPIGRAGGTVGAAATVLTTATTSSVRRPPPISPLFANIDFTAFMKDIGEPVRFVAPVGRMNRFGKGKQLCDICVEFPSGITRVVPHDKAFDSWQRVKGRSILGAIAKVCEEFAAHGGLLRNSTAVKFMMDGPTAEFQDPDSYHDKEAERALEMLRFDKWDWRRAH